MADMYEADLADLVWIATVTQCDDSWFQLKGASQEAESSRCLSIAQTLNRAAEMYESGMERTDESERFMNTMWETLRIEHQDTDTFNTYINLLIRGS